MSQAERLERIKIVSVTIDTPHLLTMVQGLFLEYAQSLSFSLCFQNFNEELSTLPGSYAPPSGRIFVAKVDGVCVGCVALHSIGDNQCELKRLYVKREYRHWGLGRLLTNKTIEAARRIGYHRVYLDTINTMVAAIKLYESVGFVKTEPYRENPIPGAVYMVLELR